MKRIYLCVALVASVWGVQMASARQITADETVTLTADSSEDYEVAANVTLTFAVASGTRTHSGTITGAGKVKKDGAGTLAISGNNSYTGGFEHSNGTVRVESATAFGTGDFVARSSSKAGTMQLIFNAPDATFENYFYASGTGGPKGTRDKPYLLFQANTTIDGDFFIGAETWIGSSSAAPTVIFNKRYGTASGHVGTIYNTYGTVHFKGAIRPTNFHVGNNASETGTIHLWSPDNDFSGQLVFCQGSVVCEAANVVSGCSLAFWRDCSSTVAVFDMNGFGQTVKGLNMYGSSTTLPTVSTPGLKVYSADPATLTLTGTGANKTETGYFAISGKASLLLNAASTFKQVITRRASDTTGSIEVRSGNFEMAEQASFKSASTITVAQGMSFLMNSTAELALENVGKLVLNGTFTVGESSSQPFGYNTLDLEMGPNAQLTLPASSTLTVKSLKVNGDDVTGMVTAGQYGLVSGTIFVKGDASSAVWTGAGNSQSIALAGNWQSQATPNLGGGLTATFAAADAQGFTANIDRDVVFDAITLSSASGFTFAGTGTMAVESGITATPPATGDRPVYEFLSPLWLYGEETMNFPTNATQRLLGGSKFTYNAVREGQGDFVVAGSNVWDRMVIVRDCNMLISGTITSSAGVDEGQLSDDKTKVDTENGIYVHMDTAKNDTGQRKSTKDAICTISNSVIERPFQIRTANVTSRDKFRAAAGTTNYFKAYFLSADQTNNGLKIPSDSEVYFDGGGAFIWSFYLNGGGTAYFRDKPIKTLNSTVGLAVTGGTKAVFEVGGNTIKAMAYEGEGTFDFRADDVVGTAGYLLVRSNGSVLHLNSTIQKMGFFSNHVAQANSYIDGDGSTLFITNNSAKRHSWIRIPFKGDVSLKVNTPSQVWLDSAASTSTGDIIVERGTLQLRSGASWTNVSEVAVSGTGRLEIQAASGVTARPVFGKKATMRLSDDGVISLPNGAAVWVKYLYVNGVPQPKGAYRYDTIQDATVKAHFDPESTGTLIVRGDGGFSLTIR